MPNWKTLVKQSNPNLHEYDIAEVSPVEVEIESYKMGEVRQDDGEKKQICFLSFKNAKKPLGLNVTNGEIISKIHGDDIDGWVGKKITLRVAECKHEMCIRVDAPKGTTINKRCPRFRYVD